MTSRSQQAAPPQSSRRAELFAQAGSEEKGGEYSSSARSQSNNNKHLERQQEQQEQQQEEDESPLQLEHILGYAGEFLNNCLFLPGDQDKYYVKGIGSLVCIESLHDAHDQKLLRGHDMPVCALALSPTGRLIASGQLGTVKFKGRAAPIFVWDAETGKRLLVLRGLTIKINVMAFSMDERFLCGCGDDSLVYVWDLQTGETISCQRVAQPVTVLKWVHQFRVSSHYTSYELVLDVGNSITSAKLHYDPSKVQWTMKFSPYAVPAGGGLSRTYCCLDCTADSQYVMVGTTAGEVLVYKRDVAVFRACIPVCHNGVQSLCILPNGAVLCGGGDGYLKMLVGEDMTWELVREARFDSRIRSLSCSSSGAELLLACSSGQILRCIADSFSYSVVGSGHISAVTCMTFSKTPGSSLFATGTAGGELRIWDVSDYACVASTSYKSSVMCLCLVDDHTLLSGWEDGFIRCHDTTTLTKQLWFIPTAHRNGTRSICAHAEGSLQFFASGGMDGAIRVWRLANRELVTQYTEHTKGVVRILVDCKSPNIIHSVGADCTVLSYDLKAARRIVCHLVTTGGSMTDMTQRRDSENELITCDTQARLLHWDVDARDPVLAVQDPSVQALRCAAVSPSGRFLAFAGDDQLIKVLDLGLGQIVALGQAHSSSIVSLAWTADERQVVTGADDSCLCIWNFYLV